MFTLGVDKKGGAFRKQEVWLQYGCFHAASHLAAQFQKNFVAQNKTATGSRKDRISSCKWAVTKAQNRKNLVYNGMRGQFLERIESTPAEPSLTYDAHDFECDISKQDFDTVSLLVPKAKQGSEEARAELIARVQDYVRLMAKQNTPANMRGKFGLSDVAQQSMAQVIQGFDQFRGNTASEFYGWLRAIVRNQALQMQREFRSAKRDVRRERQFANDSSTRQPRNFLLDDEPTPGTRAIALEQIDHVRSAINRLAPDYAEVIRLHSFQRLSFKEVAARMDRSMDSVTKLWYRAILKLEKELGTLKRNGDQ